MISFEGTNHIGHFALTLGLLPALRDGVKQSGRNARVVNLSSAGHAFANVDFNDINFKKGREFSPFISYGQSKTANILFSIGLTRHFASEGIFSNALMPGVIMTPLLKKFTGEQKEADELEANKSIEQGTSTTIWAAVAPELDGIGGKYLVVFF